MSLPDYKHAKSRCPSCSYRMDTSTKISGEEEAAPEEGDTSVCINCGQVLKYRADQTLRKATSAEVREIMDAPEAWALIEKVQRFIKQRGRFA
jgi:uncharacterized Zn finger protein